MGEPTLSPARGTRVERVGFVESVTRPAPGSAPRYQAELIPAEPRPGQTQAPADRLRLIWIGQARVPGVEAGSRLRIQGCLAEQDGMPAVFNPRYDLLSPPPSVEARRQAVSP